MVNIIGKYFYFWVLLFLLFSCVTTNQPLSDKASAPEKKVKESCLSEAAVMEVLRTLEVVADQGITGTATRTTTLKKDNCWKRVYTRNGHLLVVYKNPLDPQEKASGLARKISETEKYSEQCLSQAESDIVDLGLHSPVVVLERAKKINSWRWRDMDIGPVFWLNCDKEEQQGYLESLATLVHESVHDLKNNQCLFFTGTWALYCFKLPKDLPPRNIAAYKGFPFKDRSQVEGYEYLQNMYFKVLNNDPLILFDELNAYTATTDLYAAIIYKYGKPGLFAEDGKRSAVFLSAFMAYTVKYLLLIKKKNVSLFNLTFGPKTENHRFLISFLSESERSYKFWLAALKTVKEKPKEGESWFFSEYISKKKELGWKF